MNILQPKFIIAFLFVVASQKLVAQNEFQLAPPLLKYSSAFFSKSAKVEILFAEANTYIHYTLNGDTPTLQSPVYRTPVSISNSFTTLKARVFGKNYQPSAITQATFIKNGLAVESVSSTSPNEKYKASGTQSLVDNAGGLAEYNAGTWLGFQQDTVEIVVQLKKKEKVKSVLINALQDFDSWIFLPEKINLSYYNTFQKKYVQVTQYVTNQQQETKSTYSTPILIPFSTGQENTAENFVETNKLKIQLLLLTFIPVWHAGKGNKSWIFIDEIKIYR